MMRYTISFLASQLLLLSFVTYCLSAIAPLLLLLYLYDSWRGWRLWYKATITLEAQTKDATFLLPTNSEPALENLVSLCCKPLQLAPPRLALHATSEFFVTSDTQHHLNGTTTGDCLVLSLPMMAVLSVRELQAIIVHELAHLYYKDTLDAISAKRAQQLYYACHQQLQHSDSYTSFRALSFNLPLFLLLQTLRADSRSSIAREHRADALVRHSGLGSALGQALKKMDTIGEHFHEYARIQLTECNKDWRGENLYASFRNNPNTFSSERSDTHSSSHPSIETRLSLLHDEMAEDTSPVASSLLNNLDEIEKLVTTLFYLHIYDET